MARAIIAVGDKPNDRKGDHDRDAWIKANSNFQELYAGRLPLIVATADYAVMPGDLGQLLIADASAAPMLITLPTTDLTVGDRLYIRKLDTKSNRVTVRAGATDLAWLSATNDAVSVIWSGTAWLRLQWNIAPLRMIFTSSGSSIKPPLATMLEVMAIGGGGGGGSGRCGASSTGRSGGGSGSGGAIQIGRFPATAHGATETVTIGAGGSGGASVGPSQLNGNNGGNGGTTMLGSLIRADGGSPGGAGNVANSTAGIAPVTGAYGLSGSGNMCSLNGGGFPGGAGVTGGGGPGGGIDASNIVRWAFPGGAGSVQTTSTAGGAAGDGRTNAAGQPGASVTNASIQSGGGGGGGGWADLGMNGGVGAPGGTPGGGGGGGGACDAGYVSGAGGAGGRGELRLTWFFN